LSASGSVYRSFPSPLVPSVEMTASESAHAVPIVAADWEAVAVAVGTMIMIVAIDPTTITADRLRHAITMMTVMGRVAVVALAEETIAAGDHRDMSTVIEADSIHLLDKDHEVRDPLILVVVRFK
jgi:hypothetical protein